MLPVNLFSNGPLIRIDVANEISVRKNLRQLNDYKNGICYKFVFNKFIQNPVKYNYPFAKTL